VEACPERRRAVGTFGHGANELIQCRAALGNEVLEA
jgi:hypothetical protein